MPTQRIMPYIFIGIFVVLLAVGLVILSYLLIFGALVGMILYTVVWLRDTLFPPKKTLAKKDDRKIGRTFDQ